nr:flavodoxin family protein [uncultured Anaerosporobacter sp.]
MKVLLINGSHKSIAAEDRNSWVKYLIIKFTRKMKELYPTAEITTIRLQDYTTLFCTGCGVCVAPGISCPQDKEEGDQVQEIMERMEDSDVVILATPVYCMNVTGRMKVFLDRLTHYFFQPRMMGKIGGTIISSGGLGNKDTSEYLKNILLTMGMEYAGEMDTEVIKPDDASATKLVERIIDIYEKRASYEPTSEDKMIFQSIRDRIVNNKARTMNNYEYWKEKSILEGEYYY